MDNQTVIVVGKTELDSFGNLWVTPKGDGDRVKIGAKRSHLHPLFGQGVAVMLLWQVYQNKPYVADAKLVEGELPPPTKPGMLEEHKQIVEKAKSAPEMTKNDWAEKDKITRKSIERQSALKSATEIAVARVGKGADISTLWVIDVAHFFESYLENGIEKE